MHYHGATEAESRNSLSMQAGRCAVGSAQMYRPTAMPAALPALCAALTKYATVACAAAPLVSDRLTQHGWSATDCCPCCFWGSRFFHVPLSRCNVHGALLTGRGPFT
jgi:hypothetical protein